MELDRSIICPALVGRETEAAALSRRLASAMAGEGETVVIIGEAGIGKSRLAAEAAAEAQRRDAIVLQGRCFEPHRAVPFAPLRDLLQSFARDRSMDEIAPRFGPIASALAVVAPEVIPVLPEDLRPTSVDPGMDRHSCLALLSRFVLNLARDKPVLLIIEDLHWSDDASLAFVHHAARAFHHAPILMLLTSRSDDGNSELQHILAELRRERLSSEIHLTGLGAREVGVMIQSIFGLERAARPALVQMVEGLTNGNPFFVEEVLASLVATGDIYPAGSDWQRKPFDQIRIPRTVADAVERRLGRVSAAAQHVLETASVVGQQFEFSVLRDLTGMDELELVPLLKELVAGHLIVEESADRFAFRHALTRQAVESRLLARERQALHHRVAETLRRQLGDEIDDQIGRLAYHSFQAGEWADAIAYGLQAGDQARTLYAPHAAIEQYDRVLIAAERLGSPPPPGVYRNRGQAHETLGNFDFARTDYEVALQQAEERGDEEATWQALLDLGFLWTALDTRRAREYLEQALAQARSLGNPAWLAQSLNRLGNWLANQDQADAAIAHHGEALKIFTTLDDRHGIATTLDMLGMARSLGGDPVSSIQDSRRALAHYRELDDRHGIAGIVLMASSSPNAIYELATLPGVGTLADAIRAGEEALALARSIGWQSGEIQNLAMLGEASAAAGEFGTGLAHLEEALQLSESLGHAEWTVQSLWGLGGAYADLLALPEARAARERALRIAVELNSLLWVMTVTGGLASILIREGKPVEAEAVLVGRLSESTPKRTIGQRLCWVAEAERHLATGNPTGALELLDGLYAATPHLGDEGEIPLLAERRAEALAVLDRHSEADDLLTRAIAVTLASGARPARIRLMTLRARVRDAIGDREGSAADSSDAQALIATLAEMAPHGPLRQGFVEAATAALPGTRSSVRRADGELTSREREVAVLVAGGSSNREIAGALFVSERTAEAHVANILRKLGFTRRSQIARWAAEQGLTSPAT